MLHRPPQALPERTHLSAPNLGSKPTNPELYTQARLSKLKFCGVPSGSATVPETQGLRDVHLCCSDRHRSPTWEEEVSFSSALTVKHGQVGGRDRGCSRTEAQSMDEHRFFPQDCSAHSPIPPRPICGRATAMLNQENGS